MVNLDLDAHIGVPPFAKGGQGGFFHAPVGLTSSNPPQPPQPPFDKGGSGYSPSVSSGKRDLS